MAVITISDTGGNWNATSSWDGGVVPLATDDVLATATSGSLTVNVASTIVNIDLSLYENTLNLNAQLTINGLATIGGSMSFAGYTGNILQNGGTMSALSTAPVITRYGHSGGTINFVGDLSVMNYSVSGGPIINGTGSTLINGSFSMASVNTQWMGGTRTLKMVGTGSVSVNLNTIGSDIDFDTQGVVCPFVIDTDGTITITSLTIGHRRSTVGGSFSYIKGNIPITGSGNATSPRLILGGSNGGNPQHTFNCGGMTWSVVGFASNNTNPGIRINLLSDFKFNRTYRENPGQLTQYYLTPTWWEGSGNVYCGTPSWTGNTEIRFPAGFTHSFAKLICAPGGGIVRASGTASAPRASIINLNGTQTDYVNVAFRDINFVNTTYLLNPTASTNIFTGLTQGYAPGFSIQNINNLGITEVYSLGGAGGGISGGSFTFIS